ncbi:MAG: NAD-dependent epimerase/dehydratase family protein [Bacteroidales bacterium]|nr:NAD-dependent epimerase/dehydratase family protein [Bacteroidales bacterium]
MNILIIGGKGFLGRNIGENLSKRHNVFTIDCVVSTEKNYYNVRLEDYNSVVKIIETNDIHTVIHLASIIIPSSGIDEYIKNMDSIYYPTLKLMDYCADNKIKFIYFSSGGAVYGNQAEIFNENTRREPMSYYGISKLNFENLVQFYNRTKTLQYQIIRPSNPYGHGQNIYGRQGIIAVIIGKILKHETIEIWGDGTAVKDYIYIDDLVYYVSNLIASESDCWNSVYNIGTGVGISVNDVIHAFEDNGITLPNIRYIDAAKSDVKRMILDCTKIQTHFPHKCIPITDGIRMFWEYINKLGIW